MRFPKPLLACLFVLTLTAGSLAQADTPTVSKAWTELPRPGEPKGLFMEPTLASMGSRVHLVWSGTNSQIKHPEVFYTSISDGDKDWKSPRAPFYGRNKGRVRKLALGKSRNLIGLLFQRTLTQGNDAYEVLMAISGDQGWSWSNTIEIDSYVGDQTGGTVVAIEGREGSNRPEFALAWSREFGNVRAANFDIRSNLRPEGVLVGQHVPEAMKLDVGALGRDGFTVLFNNGAGLSSAHVKALIGQIEEASTLMRGRFGNFFTMASRPYGPSRLVVGTGTTLETLTSDGTKWKKDDGQSTQIPFDAYGATAQSDMDDDKNMHLAVIKPVPGNFQLWYVGQKDKEWGEAELVHVFDDKVDMRGFDIAATDDTVVIVASQGFQAGFFRRKL